MSARKGMNLKQVQTNADRIRNMSDEEHGTCKQKHLEWLKSKAE